MKRQELDQRVKELVAIWGPRVLPGWHISSEPTTKAHLPEGAWAASQHARGEQTIHIFVDVAQKWGAPLRNLELTVVHELVHAWWGECSAYEVEHLEEEYVRPYVPPSIYALVHEAALAAEEVLIDRTASALIKAYNRE